MSGALDLSAILPGNFHCTLPFGLFAVVFVILIGSNTLFVLTLCFSLLDSDFQFC